MADDLILHAYLGDITKSEVQPDGTLMTYGVCTGPRTDLDGERCDVGWLQRAMPKWMQRGNIREQHNPMSAIGKAQQAIETPDSEWMVAGKIVDPLAIKKTQAGVYTGYSIGVKGGVVRDGLICGGDIIEVSLVDQPAYQYSKIATAADEVGFPVMKSLGGGQYQYAGVVIETVADVKAVEPQPAPQPDSPRKTFVVRPGITTPEEIIAMTEKTVEPDLTKKDYTTEERVALAKQGKAIPVKNDKGEVVDGRYPIDNKNDLSNAIRAIGRTPAGERDEVKAHIKKQAKALDATDALPDDWDDDSKGDGDGKKTVEPDLQKDGPTQQLPTLTGGEAVHNDVVHAALQSLSTLITQELADDGEQNWCDVRELACIAEQLVQWTQGEAQDNNQGSGVPDFVANNGLPIADVVLMAAQLDPKARSEKLSALAKALQPDAEKAGGKQCPNCKTFNKADAKKCAKCGHAMDGSDEKDDARRDEGDDKDSDGDAEVKTLLAQLMKAVGAASPRKVPAPDTEKAGRTISAATAAALTSLAETPGVPENVSRALRNLARVDSKANDGPTFTPEPDGEDSPDSPGVQGVTHLIAPKPIDLMSPVNAEAEGNDGPTFQDDGQKAATLGSYIDNRAATIVKSQIEQFVTSDVFLTKLAEAGQAKVAAVEATDVAKTAAADLTKQAQQVEDLRKEMVAELHKRDDELERIKALPQAARAAITELPAGVHAVDREMAINRTQKAVEPDPEYMDLLQKMASGTAREQVLAQQRLREKMQATTHKDQEGMLQAIYASGPRRS